MRSPKTINKNSKTNSNYKFTRAQILTNLIQYLRDRLNRISIIAEKGFASYRKSNKDNVKWISIISAYDPNRLTFVTTTNQSCIFLKKIIGYS